jgi:hypothetical protein
MAEELDLLRRPLPGGPTLVGSCTAPALFLHGSEDHFVAPRHSQRLCRAYGRYTAPGPRRKPPGRRGAVPKEVRLIEGGEHNSERPAEVLRGAMAFLHTHLQQPTAAAATPPTTTTTRPPRPRPVLRPRPRPPSPSEALVAKWRRKRRQWGACSLCCVLCLGAVAAAVLLPRLLL